MAEVLWFYPLNRPGVERFSLDECTRRIWIPPSLAWRRVGPHDAEFDDRPTLLGLGWTILPDGTVWKKHPDGTVWKLPAETAVNELVSSREYLLLPPKRWLRARPDIDPPHPLVIEEVEESEMIRDLEANGIALPPEAMEIRPHWDQAGLRLSYGAIQCRKYSRYNALNQFKILNAFQGAGWPRSVDSPFDDQRTLRETIDDLNERLDKASPIRFRVEVRRPAWYPVEAPASSG
jgi:hypothetical protein